MSDGKHDEQNTPATRPSRAPSRVSRAGEGDSPRVTGGARGRHSSRPSEHT